MDRLGIPVAALDRRRFLLGTAALAAGLSLRRAALAAEGPTLTWARPSETSQYDPHASSLATGWALQHLVYEPLITLDDDLNLAPALATAWEWQGNDLVFTIRQGVKFANGRAMTLDDVVGSLERSFAAPNAWKLILRNRTGIEKRGEDQVAILFDGPNNAALHALTATLVAILPMQEIEAGSFDPASDAMLGTGPFYVESHQVNDHWVLKRNPHYWQAGLPKVETLVVRTIPAAQGLVAALRDGSADIASFDANPDAAALLAGLPNVEMATQTETSFYLLALNAVAEDSPFHDLRVRQAVALALDHQQLIDFALAGQSKQTFGWTQFGMADDSLLPLAGRDLERARALMAEAKPARTTFELVYPGTDVYAAMAQIVAQNLAEIGLQATLVGVEEGVWVKRTWGARPAEMDATVLYYSGFAHPLITAHWWAPDMAGFTAGYQAPNETYSETLIKALLGSSGAEAQAALQQVYVMINEQANQIPFAMREEIIAWRSDKVEMAPSRLQTQADILAGIETFAKKG